MTKSILRPYPQYQECSHKWLDKVPAHWKLLPHRTLFVEKKDRGVPHEELLSVSISKGITKQSDFLKNSSKKDSSNEDKSKYKLVSPNDVVFNKMRAWQGAIGVSKFRGIVSPAYIVQRLRGNHEPWFFHYLFRTPHFAKEAERWSYGITSDQWSLRAEDFKCIYSCVPPLEEQKKIVNFIQIQDHRIRKFIRNKKRLIGLLEEQWIAELERAMTFGLRSPENPRKIFHGWQKSCPAEWGIRKLNKFIYLQRGHDITEEQCKPGSVPVISSGGVSYFHDKATAFGPGVLVGRKGTAGSVHYISSEYWAHDTTLWVRYFRDCNPRFVFYFLKYFHPERFDTGSSNPTINRNLLHAELIAFPPSDEQQAIATFLDQMSNLQEGQTKAVQQQITKLNEYRSRLISDAVTGKIDLRSFPLEQTEDPIEEDQTDISANGFAGDVEPESEDEELQEDAAHAN